MRAPHSFRTFSLALALGAGLLIHSAPSIAQNATEVAWTTFKGDDSRTGSSSASLSLPLSLQWRFSSEAPARTYSTSPLIIGAAGQQKVVFAVGSEVFALDLNTGQQLWKTTSLTADISTPLTLLSTNEGDFVVGAQSNGRVFSLETLKGSVKWQTDVKSQIYQGGPLVIETAAGNRILMPLNNGTIVALDTAGKLVPDWKITLDKYASSAIGSLALSQDKSRIFVQTSDQKIVCIDAPTARILWRIASSARSTSSPLASSDNVLSAAGEFLTALRKENGTTAWRYKAPGIIQGSPALLGNTVYMGTRTGNFIALDEGTGNVKWLKKSDFSFSGSPLALKNIVLVGTANGLMVGFSPTTGEQIWEYRLRTERSVEVRQRTPRGNGGEVTPQPEAGTTGEPTETIRTFPVSSAPAAINDRVFVLGDNAALYGFTGTSFDADPPRVVGPTLSLPDTAKNLASLEVKDGQISIPGNGPIYFSLELDDIGSGIDPTSLKVLLDDEPMDEKKFDFYSQAGTLTITLVGNQRGSIALEEGLKTISIGAKDYAGNELNYKVSITVDNLVAPPEAPTETIPGAEGQAPPPFGGPPVF